MTMPLETLFAQAHAQPGEPQRRLQDALSALEGADWTLLQGGEVGLAAQLAALFSPGLIRLDPRLPVSREVFAGAGLALASSDGDWKGARAVWLLEPDERTLARARRADVPLIVDATLSPGGQWLGQGAQAVVYRDAATLTGFGDAPFTALCGLGSSPRRVAAAPADLAVALALRDLATLALRMNRRTRNAEALLPRFGGRALPVSGGVLLLEHDGPGTVTPLGGNLSAARHVPAGTLVTVGIESVEDAWLVLGGVLEPAAEEGAGRGEQRASEPAPASSGQMSARSEQPRPEQARPEQARVEPAQSQPAQSQPARLEPTRPLPPRPASALSGPTEPVAADPAPAQSGPSQSGPAAGEPSVPPDATPGQLPAANPADYSDREFVFSPLPAAATPAPAAEVQPPAPVPSPIPGGSRRGRGRRGGRPTGMPDAGSPSPELQPEIVLSESFQRSPGTDAWPEAAAGLDGGGEQGQDADPAEAQPVAPPQATPPQATQARPEPAADLPLQLPPDLPEPSASDPAADLTQEQAAIYERLREWRNAEAKRQTVSRFIIASNATLAEIARRVPYTEADLMAVKGMGPERLRKYGEKLLEVVRG